MPDGDNETPRWSWLAGAGTLVSLLACYGTLLAVSALSLVGITIAINVHLWAGAIVLFALIAVIGVASGYRRHRRIGPLALASCGALLVIWAMYGSASIHALLGFPSRVVELTGFAMLVVAACWDWRRRKPPVGKPAG